MTNWTIRTTTAWLLCAASALPAHAGRPLQTEDAGVLEPRECEVEGATARLSVAGVSAREHSLQFGCGAGVSTQLAAALSRASAEGTSARGLQLSGKTALWQARPAAAGEEAAALALAYGLLSAKVSGERWRHAASELNLVYSAPVSAVVTMHVNLGHARDAIDKLASTTWGLALEHGRFGAWAPMVELVGDDREAPWWNLGLRYTAVADKAFFDVSFGRQMVGGRPRLVTFGFKLGF
jgi:hypothetical protein